MAWFELGNKYEFYEEKKVNMIFQNFFKLFHRAKKHALNALN